MTARMMFSVTSFSRTHFTSGATKKRAPRLLQNEHRSPCIEHTVVILPKQASWPNEWPSARASRATEQKVVRESQSRRSRGWFSRHLCSRNEKATHSWRRDGRHHDGEPPAEKTARKQMVDRDC